MAIHLFGLDGTSTNLILVSGPVYISGPFYPTVLSTGHLKLGSATFSAADGDTVS